MGRHRHLQADLEEAPGAEGTGEPRSVQAAAGWGCHADHRPLVPHPSVSPQDEALWCRTTRALQEDEVLCAFVLAEPLAIPNHHAVTVEPSDSPYPAALHSDIQLLPQQAGMATILATAMVNSESSGMRSTGNGDVVQPHGAGAVPCIRSLPLKYVLSLSLSPPQRMFSHARTAGSGTGASATCKHT